MKYDKITHSNKYIKPLIISCLVIITIFVLNPLRNEAFLNIFARYYFDKNYYLNNYPDVKNLNIDPFKHYIKFGWKEKKNPSASFNTTFYANVYLLHNNKYNLNPLAHYARSKILFKNLQQMAAKVHLLENPKYYISLVSVFQNEARFLKEWIEFYLNLGVEHFYLYNHLSTDNYIEVLEPYINSGIVGLKDVKEKPTSLVEWNNLQCNIYTKTAQEVKDITEWLIVVDTDEFLFPVKEDNLKEVLKKYDGYATVSVNWKIFGSSDVEKIQANKLMIESLTKSDNIKDHHVKSIIKPRYVSGFGNPHFPNLLQGYYQVTENFEYFSGPFLPSESRNILRINHYWARDLEFYKTHKIRRHSFNDLTEDEKKTNTNKMVQHNQNLSVNYDDSILRFVKDIRKRMAMEN